MENGNKEIESLTDEKMKFKSRERNKKRGKKIKKNYFN